MHLAIKMLSLNLKSTRGCGDLSLSDLPWWLILIRQKALVGKLPGDHEVCKVTKIAVLSLSEMEPQDLELEVRWKRKPQGSLTDTE